MRRSQPKNDGRGRVCGGGGSWVKSVFAHFDHFERSFRISEMPCDIS